MTDKVNVLLVDDQPDKLLAYDVILNELGENSSRRRPRARPCIPAQERGRGRSGRRLHAGARRLRACQNDPGASAFKETAIIFISAIHLTDVDASAVSDGRGRLRPGAGRSRSAARQGQDIRRAYRKTRELQQLNLKLERHVAERTAELEILQRTTVAERTGRSLALRPVKWVPGTGIPRATMALGRGPVSDIRRRAANV